MKHLLCEKENTIAELKADGLVSTELVQKKQEQLETELHKEMKAIMVGLQGLDIEDLVKELELVCSSRLIIFFTKIKDLWI